MSEPVVLYNGGCPVCAGGMDVYRHGAKPDACGTVDVRQQPETLAQHGLTLNDVIHRVHFVTADGAVLRGMPAIAALWERDGRFRLLTRLVRLPVVKPLAALAYEAVAAPLYVWNLRRERRRTTASAARRP